MPKIPITERNPFGLSVKQRLVIEDIVFDIKNGKKFDPVKSHMKYYNINNKRTASSISSENLTRPNVVAALSSMLEYYGVSGKMAQVISDGLNAQKKIGNACYPDYDVRLKYIQEINKIAGLY